MIISTTRNNKTEVRYNGLANPKLSDSGIILEVNRSKAADKRFNFYHVELRNDELIKALKWRLRGKLPKLAINLIAHFLCKAMN
jgi:hypothetical protein